MQYRTTLNALSVALAVLMAPLVVEAQTSVNEDFTSATTNGSWYYFYDACLTAGTQSGTEPTTVGTSPTSGSGGQIPGCVAIQSTYGENLVGGQNGIAGNTQTLPDPVGQGALRFTNGNPGGFSQHGSIISATPFPSGQGVAVTFKTVTYRGNSGGAGMDGADGISFFLMDANQAPNIGSWGGSLGYSCSNANPPYTGLVGAYIGLGIDEFGNFLNGTSLMPGYTGGNNATGDNTALGYGYKPDRIGMRGAGNIAWSWLNANYPTYYPSSFTGAQQATAVKETCASGLLWNEATNQAVTISGSTVPVLDYAPIPNAYVELPSTFQIASESAMARPQANTIFYSLKISQDGLLSLSYSYNGGAYQQVIKQQNITTSNGALPANFLFGFAGSTGGSSNIHEILCFKAVPATSASSSAGSSEKQSAKLETGAQVYFAYYNQNDGWTGRVTATNLSYDTYGNVIVASTPNWDASCNLTGVAASKTCASTGVAGPIAAQNFQTGASPNGRVILSWNGSSGIPFEWANLSATQQAAIDAGDTGPLNANRVNYLRGDRSNEVNTSGVGLFRRRDSVLADIIDASPAWVGPPSLSYPVSWVDRLNPSATPAENATSAQTYPAYTSSSQTRLTVVYAGANDGLIHGFRSGSYDTSNNFVVSSNDGEEVLAYMPGAVVQTIHSSTASLDYPNTQYSHNYFVDATPGTGDLFYQNQWHTWLVGGLGPGGAAIYALDVTNPSATNFAEANAASLVLGEWTPTTISCTNVGNCGNNLGNTYGTPVIRRLHDGKWAVIFGNGFGSTSGDAGIYVMTVDPSSAAKTFYYLSTSTGSASSPNGIAYVSAADLDGDHVADYVYAGDLQGNLWRFDLTSSSESNWAVTPGPLFTTPSGQPITTAIAGAIGAAGPGMPQQLMLLFGTGQKTPLNASSPATYATGTQSFYGVWDWNMTAWNANSAATYAALPAGSVGTLLQANLLQQVITVNATTQNRDITGSATPCWAGQISCGGSNAQYGWYMNFPGTQEQVVYSPELIAPAVTVNSVVPAPNNPTSCGAVFDAGFTYVMNALTGGSYAYAFYPPSIQTELTANPNQTLKAQLDDQFAAGIQTNATGTSVVVTNNNGGTSLVFQNNQACVSSGTCTNVTNLNIPNNVSGRRVSWIQRR